MKSLSFLTGSMGSARELAEMVRRMGRGKDTMLAHITPEEAEMLRKRGGSGTINPQTGLPEFQPEYNYDVEAQQGGFYGDMPAPEIDYRQQVRAAEPPGYYGTMVQPAQPLMPVSMPNMPVRDVTAPAVERYGQTPDLRQYEGELPGGAGGGMITPRGDTAGAPSFLESAEERLRKLSESLSGFTQKYPTVSRIGASALGSLPALLQARRAKEQSGRLAEQIRATAAPARQASEEAMARARGGGLTPEEQRRLQIEQARARQGIAAGRGSAASGILAGQEQRLRSQARGRSFDEAITLANFADERLADALRAELAGDKEVADLLTGILSKEMDRFTQRELRSPEGRQ